MKPTPPIAGASAAPTIRAALRSARSRLRACDCPDLDAQVLLAQILNVERAFLFAHGERALSEIQRRRYEAAIERCAKGEPVAYITGSRGFYDLDLVVTPAVLTPRPETELLLERALRLTPAGEALTAADIGTGSGALAVAFARHRPLCTVFATDISAECLAIARQNAERYATPVSFLVGNLAQPLVDRGVKVDLVMANLPYIASDLLESLPVSRYEPRQALDGGEDGLACIRELLGQLPRFCGAGAHILLEIGADQGEAVAALVHNRLGAECRILRDYAALDRIAQFQIP